MESSIFGKYQNTIRIILTLIRIFIGWHFLYEGLSKIYSQWSSAGYLLESQWIFSGIFHRVAEHPGLLHAVDLLNIAGLILVGIGLVLGLFTRISAFTGAFLILLYYIANPPFIGYISETTGEGHYLIINRQVIEMFILILFVFLPKDYSWSFNRWISREIQNRKDKKEGTKQLNRSVIGRREILKDLIALPFLGGLAWMSIKKKKWESHEELNLISQASRVDASSGASPMFQYAKLDQLKHKVPVGKIKNYEISRLICGGNLISGYAHSRDLIYVSSLVNSYFNDEKVIETLKLCEAAGINTMIVRVDTNTLKVFKKYRKRGGTLQWIAQCKVTEDNIKSDIDAAIANGAIGVYLQGDLCDQLVRANNIDLIMRTAEYMKRQDQIIYGLAGHDLKVIIECERHGLDPDFYMKTFNSANYWTAGPRLITDPDWKPDPSFDVVDPEFGANTHDNIWCDTPSQTAEFMKKVEKPWIAFKVLGAGAIHPSEGFKYAFNNGADFACVGMFDFQIIDDANIAWEALSNLHNRERPWRG